MNQGTVINKRDRNLDIVSEDILKRLLASFISIVSSFNTEYTFYIVINSILVSLAERNLKNLIKRLDPQGSVMTRLDKIFLCGCGFNIEKCKKMFS